MGLLELQERGQSKGEGGWKKVREGGRRGKEEGEGRRKVREGGR